MTPHTVDTIVPAPVAPPPRGVPTQPEPPTDPDIPTEPIYRLSVEQYHAMIAASILDEDDPVELLEGWLVIKMPQNPPHIFATQVLRDHFGQLLPEGWFVNDQSPVTTGDSEPEPDIQAVRGERRQYLKRHAGPEDIGLLVEVSDSSLRRDRGLKQRIFARARMPVYWIINLGERRIEVYTDPTGPCDEPTYRQRQDYGENDEVPVVLDGREVGRLQVRDILP